MPKIYCIMFTFSLNDDVRDMLFATAYLMIRDGTKRKKVKNGFCEGFVRKLNPIAIYGMAGVEFQAHLETEKGDLKVSYMVRPKDLGAIEEAEDGAWLTPEELDNPPEGKRRPNPIRRVANKYQGN